MIIEFRKLLVWIRKKRNKKTYTILGSILFVSIVGGILSDIFLPINIWWNTFRTIFVIGIGFPLFLILYLYSSKMYYERRREDDEYQRWKEKYSHNQRINLSLIVGSIIIILYFLIIKPQLPGYTPISGLLFTMAPVLVAFSMIERDEYLRNLHSVEDPRDRVVRREVERVQALREEKSLSKKEKKNKKKEK